jgi:hypothetical protein
MPARIKRPFVPLSLVKALALPENPKPSTTVRAIAEMDCLAVLFILSPFCQSLLAYINIGTYQQVLCQPV